MVGSRLVQGWFVPTTWHSAAPSVLPRITHLWDQWYMHASHNRTSAWSACVNRGAGGWERCERDRERDRERDTERPRETDRGRERPTEAERGRECDRQRPRVRPRVCDRERETEREGTYPPKPATPSYSAPVQKMDASCPREGLSNLCSSANRGKPSGTLNK